ncbi:unnamed protein product [Psylliodes chrysocephalus]|uniref:PHD-type domain-containing protein n=1 Tax=Psylliodes chrysocephalus TaxID=3402493 RepID=A0A9P0GIX0_9CUCU|nr:unnamed protein product [Psylliodes chrysocephala]
MPNLICSCCNKSYKSNFMIKCSVCTKVFRHLCVNVTLEEINMFNDNENGFDWSCTSCRTIGNQIKDLNALILMLQEEVKSLKEDNKQLGTSNNSIVFEEVVQEINERNKRKRNIILFGVPEQDQVLSTEDRSENDKTEVKSIIKYIDRSIDLKHLKPIRLGRFSDSRNRPMKITMEEETDVVSLIKQASSLKNGKYKHVSISFDRTKRQIDYYRQLKMELDEKNNKCTEKFRIRYVDGTPTIVPLNR